MSRILQERITPVAVAGAGRLARLRELAEQDRSGNDFYLDWAKQLNAWRRRLKTVLPMLSALRGLKSTKQTIQVPTARTSTRSPFALKGSDGARV